MCPNSWHELTTCNDMMMIIINSPQQSYSKAEFLLHLHHLVLELHLLPHYPPLVVKFSSSSSRSRRNYKNWRKFAPGRIMGPTLLLQAFFITTFLPSTATALILNYTTRGCSKHCESIHCDNAHSIRYGKFCGVGYTGCPNQSPCDRLDACCRQHDFCVGTNPANFPNQTCRYHFQSCLEQYLSTGASVYHGSNCTAMTVQNTLMVAVESTTYQQAPGSAPQAGAAPDSVSAKALESMAIPVVFIFGVCVILLMAQERSADLRSI